MALSLTTRATVTNSASADTLATGSFTPSNNSLLVVIATGLLPQGRASAPTITGGGLTWTNWNSVEALVLYRKNAGANTTWRLVAYIDTGQTGLPVTPNGGNISITFNASGILAL